MGTVFDEGTDQPIGPPPGCTGSVAAGFVHLDNITVKRTVGGTQVVNVWQSASDNGRQAFVPAVGPDVAFAEEFVSVEAILEELQELFPTVPVTSWVLYPDVEIPTPKLP
jgi:hypothetical protein